MIRRGLVLVFFVVLGVALGQWLIQGLFRPERAIAQPREVTPRAGLDASERSRIDLFRDAAPSVVLITAQQRARNLFGRDIMNVPAGTGTGFIWDTQGHIVTNFHVIRGANAGVTVTLADQRSFSAEVVGVSEANDLAVLRIDAPSGSVRPLPVGTSDDLQVGQDVLAIGNPFGLDTTLTTGIVSALGRSITSPTGVTIENVIQTDAAINPGNSGGPLLDSAGRLVGVNTAILSRTGANVGIGFAVPVDTVNRIVPQLISTGRVERAVLGVRMLAPQVNGNVVERLGIQGVLVLDVIPDSGAAAAGLRPTQQDDRGRLVFGDVIVEIEGRKITSPGNLAGVLGLFAPGRTVRVNVWRNGEIVQMRVTLDRGE